MAPPSSEEERRGPESLGDRSEQHRSSRDRRQQDVADVGASIETGPPSAPLRRPSANAPTTNSPITAGPRVEQVGGVDLVTDRAVDRVGEPDDHRQPDETEQIDAVGDLVPVGVAEAPTLSRPAEVLQGVSGCALHRNRDRVDRHRRTTVSPSLHTCVVTTETAQLFFGLLTLAAGIGAIAFVVLRLVAASGNDASAATRCGDR